MNKVKLTVPNKLSEITLGQYQRFSKIMSKKPDEDFLQKKMVEIFCGVPLSEVVKFKYKSIVQIVKTLSDMFDNKPKLKEMFKMNGIEFGIIPQLSEMTFGEFVDLDTYVNDWENMDKAMSVLFRPIKEKFRGRYLINDYTAEEENDFKNMPLDVALGAVFFLFNLNKELTRNTLSYLQKNLQKSTTQEQLNFPKNMDGSQVCTDLLEQIRQDLKQLKSSTLEHV